MAKFMTLLVENDVLQREVLAEVLKDEGFEVVECSTAEAAELVVSTSGTELRAIIADQHLDGQMLGSELASFARLKYPDLNIILMSGQQNRNFRRGRRSCTSRSCRLICWKRYGAEPSTVRPAKRLRRA